jgi:PhoPQ-activated pathogenicity-related protein
MNHTYVQRSAQYSVLKDVNFTHARRVILAIQIQVILAFTRTNHATYSRPTISQHVSDVTLPLLCFRNILRSNENLLILFTSSKYYY